mgnify:CR=1 FL=1
MLEDEIKNLAAEIKMLREAMTATSLPTPKAEKPKAEKPKAEKPKAEKPKAEEPAAPTISIEDLQAMCVTITRADKTMRASIVGLLDAHGATRLDQVDASKYGELAESLKALGV